MTENFVTDAEYALNAGYGINEATLHLVRKK